MQIGFSKGLFTLITFNFNMVNLKIAIKVQKIYTVFVDYYSTFDTI